MIKNNKINLHCLLTNEMLADDITKSLKLIKHTKFIKTLELKQKKIKIKKIN